MPKNRFLRGGSVIEINGKFLCDGCFEKIEKDASCDCGFSENPVGSLSNGTILNGRFIVGKQVRESKTVKEYLCYDPQKSDTVLIKEFFPKFLVSRKNGTATLLKDADDLNAYNSAMQRFINLMQIPQSLSDFTGFIKVENAFYENNTAYFVVEKHSLVSVREHIGEGKRFTDKQVVLSLNTAAKCLVELKKQGFINGNISDRNVYTDGESIVTDGFEPDEDDLVSYMKESVVFRKTSCYMAASDFAKEGKNIFSDIFSFGAVLYTMLTSKQPGSPFDGENQFDKNALENSTEDKLLLKIIRRMCRIDEEKYESLSAFAKDVNRLSGKYGFEKVEVIKEIEETKKIKSHGKGIKVLIVIILALAIVVTVFAFADKLPFLKDMEIPSLSEMFSKLWHFIKSKFSGGLL